MSGIRARLLLLVGLAIGPLFAFTLYQGLEERRRAGVRERVDARRLVLLFAAEHGRVVANTRQLLFVLAQAPVVRRGDAEACAGLFRDVLAASPQYGNLLLARVDGVVVASAQPANVDGEGRALLARAAATTFAVGPIRLAGPATVPTFSVVHAVPNGPGAPRMVLVAELVMRWVATEVAVAGLDALTRVTLWDASGRILLRHPDPEGILGRDASTSEVWQEVVASRGEGTAVNDRLGHGAGDDVLREVARRLQATLRATDLAARYGGEEFAVLLPETTLETAREAAERIRLAVGEALIKTRRGPVNVTLSAGVAVLDEHTQELKHLFEAADAALYDAKVAGRNRVSSAPASGPRRT